MASAQIMSVDLGHEFFKVALMRQGKPLEIVLNTHSKRKTTTAVSFHEAVRVFGDDALAHQGKAPAKVPMFFHSALGKNYTADDIMEGGKWWADFGLGDRFYAFDLIYNSDRGVPMFKLGDDWHATGEEVLAHVLFFCKQIAEASGEGETFTVKDVVITVPSDATLRQRQAVQAAAEIAGLRLLTLVHEGSAFAVQRAVDYSPEQGNSEIALFYNLGSRKAEATIVRFEARSAGMVKGKTAPVVEVLGSIVDARVGGHLMDLKIAEVMLKRFQEKNPKLADGVGKNPRALRKLLAQAAKTKATLSANKAAPFTVESLYQDTDFQATIQREEFDVMCADMFAILTEPIEKALVKANVSLKNLTHVEVVGGAWRVPKVQEIISKYLEDAIGERVPLGQHLNGEEAAALGAALIAANASTSFRVRKIFFSDITQHEYSVQIAALSGAWDKNVTILYPAGAALGGKKKLAFSAEEDFSVRVFEDGVLITEYEVTGLSDLMQGKWKEYNLTGMPKVSATVPLELSGIVELKNPTVTVEELRWVNATTEKKNKTGGTNLTSTAASRANASANETGDEATTSDGDKVAAANGDADGFAAANDSNATSEPEPEFVLKQKKKKHEQKLKVAKKEFFPLPLSEDEVTQIKKSLAELALKENDVKALAGLKNELEASIYGSREKVEHADIRHVTTQEQRDALTALASELEEWMYESGATKSDYEQNIARLQGVMLPMEERARELELRSGIVESVAESVGDMKSSMAHVEANMTWVSPNKTEAVGRKLQEFEQWWAKKMERQESLPLHEAPAFTVKEVNEKVSKLQKELDKLKKTKKPKEKAPKDEKTAPKSKGNDAKDAAEANMPEDISATEKELEQLRETKAAAVESEDYDKAHSLKQRESALVKHLERLHAAKSEL
eukprot:CAMPEP_0170213858 /NCGR_PEP_ID=MMETSP0116_2-20130129/6555_1 /TAXON_ID=400756 /ORGANISM="Durinskia baltica, Strain CSIRO CS-38" /LENGTH=906 /DNA_ID=CAMNT_0010464413 /DNA_START=121 /DNA_END=2841 /DNA_ORIENTATION=+